MSERGIELGIASQYIDAGDIVVAQFTVDGTNDGRLGSLKPTGRKISLAFCEIYHFDKEGRTVSGGCYYDQYTVEKRLDELEVTQRAQERAFLQASPSDGKQQGGN